MANRGIQVLTEVSGFGKVDSWLQQMILESDEIYLVGTNVEYSIYVEFGTSSTAAQPYLFPAVESALSEVHQIWEDTGYDINATVRTLAFRIEAYAKFRCPVDTGNLRSSISVTRVQ